GRPPPVDIAVTPPHRSLDRPQIGPRGVEEGLPESPPARLVADEGGIDIPERAVELSPESVAEGLLPAAHVDTADDFPAAVEGRDFILEGARGEHAAIGADECIRADGDGTGCWKISCGHGLDS